jgi:hypothetical protein
MTAFRNVSDEQIQTAEVIATYDAAGNYLHQLWGQESLGKCSLPGTPPHRINVLDITIDVPEKELLSLMCRIQTLRGRVPSEKQELFDQLTEASSV